MTPLRLKNPNGGYPPGGWAFHDNRTGLNFDGMSATLEQQELKIIQHRRANPRVYPQSEGNWFERQSVRQEIFQQLHAKSPGLFVGFERQAITKTKFVIGSQPTTKCTCGESEATPVYCATCGGQKISGWKCVKCGKQRSR